MLWMLYIHERPLNTGSSPASWQNQFIQQISKIIQARKCTHVLVGLPSFIHSTGNFTQLKWEKYPWNTAAEMLTETLPIYLLVPGPNTTHSVYSTRNIPWHYDNLIIVRSTLMMLIVFTNLCVTIDSRAFHKLDKIGSNTNIGIRGFTMWKQKIPVTKCYNPPPPRGLNPGLCLTSDPKSNTVLSELVWHVLLRRSLNFCLWTTCYLDLDDLVGINRAWL